MDSSSSSSSSSVSTFPEQNQNGYFPSENKDQPQGEEWGHFLEI
jgi:hypothetical protein